MGKKNVEIIGLSSGMESEKGIWRGRAYMLNRFVRGDVTSKG